MTTDYQERPMDPLNPLRDAREMADRLPDPPYVHGDHAATCKGEFGWGCEQCNPSEDDRQVPVCWRCEWVAADCVCPEGPQTDRPACDECDALLVPGRDGPRHPNPPCAAPTLRRTDIPT